VTTLYVLIFFAGLTIGQWLAIWGLLKLLAMVIQSIDE
jgi:hypothetical protein